MKDGIHPNYREVCFMDLSNNAKFVIRSCVNTKEMIKMDDGKELPLYKLDTSSESHPSTPAHKNPWTTWVAAWRNSAIVLHAHRLLRRLELEANRTCVTIKRQPGQPACLFCHHLIDEIQSYSFHTTNTCDRHARGGASHATLGFGELVCGVCIGWVSWA